MAANCIQIHACTGGRYAYFAAAQLGAVVQAVAYERDRLRRARQPFYSLQNQCVSLS
jgi:hypothetical protein